MEQGVLLGLVEPVDFINKQDGLAPQLTIAPPRFQNSPYFPDSCSYRGELVESGLGVARQELSQGGLAGARRYIWWGCPNRV